MTDEREQTDRVRNRELDAIEERESLKKHGDALQDRSGSRQGERPDPGRDAVPREGERG